MSPTWSRRTRPFPSSECGAMLTTNPGESPNLFTLSFEATDDLLDDQRWSTYWDVERLCRGPEPVPDWVVQDRAAVDTELGVLKTGKEADVHLLRRAVPGTTGSTLAAKRYRGEEHRSFHRSAAYTEGRRMRNTRDARALTKKSKHGRSVAAGQWAWAEWQALTRFWSAGVPVPYPVQVDGTEILMELVTGSDGGAAPRLAATRPERPLLEHYYDQVRDILGLLARAGVVHGDLSPYNVLAADDRLVVIDLPQVVDLVANPAGTDFLLRDCRNMCAWFVRRGLEVDEQSLFAEVVAQAF
ncbi:MAG: RIO1/ZK632.3/MJ0444 family protein [uncultured Nocardioidaceae bacterium]|uniref:non-specific serine/threonine protein kinase n=1 Tax=uncultured Nocardioidaceae bacterium TaxID=253824 RepID=A0A6J4LGM3_9ACTN|nr:MAG: RIO1/ZK632.3/MJ0444 family protein [uncultured Nocardioidaceae bacterium]